jgi:hypothetical protein
MLSLVCLAVHGDDFLLEVSVPNPSSQRKTTSANREQRKLRRRQFLFIALSIILILSWIAALLINI